MNVIVEPTEEEDGEYLISSYSFVKSNSKWVPIGLRNMNCITDILNKGMVITQLSPSNVVPNMLAPKLETKLASCQLELGTKYKANCLIL